jgi:hypothetical protein
VMGYDRLSAAAKGLLLELQRLYRCRRAARA